MPEQGRVFAGCVRQRLHVKAGDDEEVDGRLRMKVGEGNDLIILVQEVDGNSAGSDRAEDAVHGATIPDPPEIGCCFPSRCRERDPACM